MRSLSKIAVRLAAYIGAANSSRDIGSINDPHEGVLHNSPGRFHPVLDDNSLPARHGKGLAGLDDLAPRYEFVAHGWRDQVDLELHGQDALIGFKQGEACVAAGGI